MNLAAMTLSAYSFRKSGALEDVHHEHVARVYDHLDRPAQSSSIVTTLAYWRQ